MELATMTWQLEALFLIVGEIVFYLILFIIIAAVILAILISISFKTGYFPFPNLFILAIIALEAPIRAIFRLVGTEDAVVDLVCIDLINLINLKPYKAIPIAKKAIFLPQCLRSIECPAKLSPEGIQCIACGRCKLKDAKEEAERLGYKVFIVPGSSFIRRMIAKYKPSAILGVGCVEEVRDGLDMCHKHKIPAQGIVLDEAGCIATKLNWEKFYKKLREN
ncbi:MAG: DUF116 domain-containing protein [Halobacteria archaeon]